MDCGLSKMKDFYISIYTDPTNSYLRGDNVPRSISSATEASSYFGEYLTKIMKEQNQICTNTREYIDDFLNEEWTKESLAQESNFSSSLFKKYSSQMSFILTNEKDCLNDDYLDKATQSKEVYELMENEINIRDSANQLQELCSKKYSKSDFYSISSLEKEINKIDAVMSSSLSSNSRITQYSSKCNSTKRKLNKFKPEIQKAEQKRREELFWLKIEPSCLCLDTHVR